MVWFLLEAKVEIEASYYIRNRDADGLNMDLLAGGKVSLNVDVGHEIEVGCTDSCGVGDGPLRRDVRPSYCEP
jgi:hypothetical protein